MNEKDKEIEAALTENIIEVSVHQSNTIQNVRRIKIIEPRPVHIELTSMKLTKEILKKKEKS